MRVRWCSGISLSFDTYLHVCKYRALQERPKGSRMNRSTEHTTMLTMLMLVIIVSPSRFRRA